MIFDPYASSLGATPFRAKADVVVLSCPQDELISQTSGISGEPLTIDTPGEYSVKGITLHGVGVRAEDGKERAVFRCHIEGITVLIVGAVDRMLTESELGDITKTDIDVLVLPVGGGSSLTTKQALELVSLVEPRVVIPVHFAIPKWKEKLETVDTFAKEMGANPKATERKVILKANKLPTEDVETVLLVP